MNSSTGCSTMGAGFSSSVDHSLRVCLNAVGKHEYLAAGGLAVASSLGFLANHWRSCEQPQSDWYKGKAVFITGCDSGLGFSFANYCHNLGMVVIAACHTASSTQGAEELEKLGSSARMFVIRNFDVRSKESIVMARTVVETVLSETKTDLWAVVNNAAMLVLAKLEWMTDTMIESQIQVNLVGPIHVCRVFLPLLYKTRGSRIINITSPCAETCLPMAGVYGATKAGLDTISDSLRIEASAHGVNMVLLDPGEILSLTPFASRQGSHYMAMEAEMDKTLSKQEMATFHKFSDVFSNHLPRPQLGIIEEKRIYRVFLAALCSTHPSRRYSAATWRVRCYELFMIWAPSAWGDREKRKLLQM